jgi:hypothetical protein
MSDERTFVVAVPRFEVIEEIEAPSAGDAVHRLFDSSSGVFEEKTESTLFGEVFGSTAGQTIAWVMDTADDRVKRFKLTLGWTPSLEAV